MSSSADTLTLLDRLVGFPSVAGHTNLPLMDFVEAHLAGAGFACRRIASEDGTRSNLFASIGPADRPGVVLSSHTDVVSTDEQDWSADPFRLRIEDGRAIGRGTTDMKGFLASALRAAARAATTELARPLHLALSYDEELGCVGVRRMIDTLGSLPPPSLCVVGEPTCMGAVIAHKGKLMGDIVCHGIPGHSSVPAVGINAIEIAADMVVAAREIAAELRAAGRAPGFTVPFTTLHIGTIAAGRAVNLIPSLCRMAFEIRNAPDDDVAAVLARLEAAAADVAGSYPAGAVVEIVTTGSYPAFAIAPDSDAVATVQRIAGTTGTQKVGYGTEAGLFQSVLGWPAVVCGPGDVAQAHKADEFIALSELAACDRFLDRLVDTLAEPGAG